MIIAFEFSNILCVLIFYVLEAVVGFDYGIAWSESEQEQGQDHKKTGQILDNLDEHVNEDSCLSKHI